MCASHNIHSEHSRALVCDDPYHIVIQHLSLAMLALHTHRPLTQIYFKMFTAVVSMQTEVRDGSYEGGVREVQRFGSDI